MTAAEVATVISDDDDDTTQDAFADAVRTFLTEYGLEPKSTFSRKWLKRSLNMMDLRRKGAFLAAIHGPVLPSNKSYRVAPRMPKSRSSPITLSLNELFSTSFALPFADVPAVLGSAPFSLFTSA